MPTDVLKDFLKRAKVPFNRRDKKQDLAEKALQSTEVLAMVDEEAKAQGEHTDGAKVELETVEGSFVNIDSSMLVQGTLPTRAEQTSVRHSTLATNTRLSILLIAPLGFACHTPGHSSVRAFANVVCVLPDTLRSRKRRSHSPNPTPDSAVVVDPKGVSRTGRASPTRSSLSDSGLTAVDNAELANIQEVRQMAELIKGVMGEMGLSFDSLGGQTAYLSSMAPVMETQHNIRKKVDQFLYTSTY